MLQRWVDRSITLATIMEDLPYPDNRVEPAFEDGDAAAVRLTYRLRDADRARIAHLRRLMRGVLRGRRWRLLKQAENNQRIAHVCGTCRFGVDPATSVLDPDNRCHDLDNLYVVDSSFFPSSGGTNPSLTIAANALRVAERLRGSA
jgi:choline dehydrogenase-like flavoprotein